MCNIQFKPNNQQTLNKELCDLKLCVKATVGFIFQRNRNYSANSALSAIVPRMYQVEGYV